MNSIHSVHIFSSVYFTVPLTGSTDFCSFHAQSLENSISPSITELNQPLFQNTRFNKIHNHFITKMHLYPHYCEFLQWDDALYHIYRNGYWKNILQGSQLCNLITIGSIHLLAVVTVIHAAVQSVGQHRRAAQGSPLGAASRTAGDEPQLLFCSPNERSLNLRLVWQNRRNKKIMAV